MPERLGDPFPEVVHALKVRRAIEKIAATSGVDLVHDHTFAGPSTHRPTPVSACRRW
jgi:hypothetical protein